MFGKPCIPFLTIAKVITKMLHKETFSRQRKCRILIKSSQTSFEVELIRVREASKQPI